MDLVGVTVGPGSFTSLRVGVTAAKTLAYVAGAKVAPVNTLEAIAWTFLASDPNATGKLWAVMNAERDEWFVQCFDATKPGAFQVHPKAEYSLYASDHLVTLLSPQDTLLGSGVQRLVDRVAPGVVVMELEPTAEAVTRLAIRQAAAGLTLEPIELVPDYGRLSAAEEKRGPAS